MLQLSLIAGSGVRRDLSVMAGQGKGGGAGRQGWIVAQEVVQNQAKRNYLARFTLPLPLPLLTTTPTHSPNLSPTPFSSL